MSRRKLSDNAKAMIGRWYLAGAVYFFVAFGTPLGSRLTTIDLTCALALAIALLTVFVLDPVLWRMLDLTECGRVVNPAYFRRSRAVAAACRLGQILRCMLVVVLVACTYHAGNRLLAALLGLGRDAVVWKGEPFLFATLYVFWYWLTDKVRLTVKKRRGGCHAVSVDDGR